jgi:hypothetical protein
MIKQQVKTKSSNPRALKRKAIRFVNKNINTSSATVYYLRTPYFTDMIAAINLLISDMKNNPVEGVDAERLEELWQKVRLPIQQQLWAVSGKEHFFDYIHRVDRYTHLILCSFAFMAYMYVKKTPHENIKVETIHLPMFQNWVASFLNKYAKDFEVRGIFEMDEIVEIYDELFRDKEQDTELSIKDTE